MPVAEEDEDKTPSTSHAGRYRFNQMPFGLTNAPASFQRALNITLSKFTLKSYLAYVYNTITVYKDNNQQLGDVSDVLSALYAAGVSMKLKNATGLQLK